MQCAEIDGNATPSDFSVNYYNLLEFSEHTFNFSLSLTIVAHPHTGMF